jgi:hypothetical protein
MMNPPNKPDGRDYHRRCFVKRENMDWVLQPVYTEMHRSIPTSVLLWNRETESYDTFIVEKRKTNVFYQLIEKGFETKS